MRNGKKVIGICTAELEQTFHAKLLERVMKELMDRENDVLVFSLDSDMYNHTDSDEGDAAIFELPNYDIIDVILIFSMTIRSPEDVREIANRAKSEDIPVVLVDMEIEGCYNVIYNTEDAFERVVRHVIEYHGVREINFLAGIEGDEFSEQRLNVFKRVLDDNDIPFEEERVGYGGFWEGPTFEVMKDFMHPSKVPPEAIICSNDSMAVAVCDYLAEMDVMVPDEILVTGIDGIDEGKLHSPGITTAVRDEVNDAKKIADLVHSILLGERATKHMELGYHMQLSQSCGCQKHHLFDKTRLLRTLNTELALRIADIRRYERLMGVILKKKMLDDEVFDSVAELLPEDSFICINDDLEVGKKDNNKHRRRKNPFTEKLKAVVKIGGKIERGSCSLRNMVPEQGKDMGDAAVIFMPIHFEERVVGYLGIWRSDLSEFNRVSHLHFLKSLDNSLAYKLSE